MLVLETFCLQYTALRKLKLELNADHGFVITFSVGCGYFSCVELNPENEYVINFLIGQNY